MDSETKKTWGGRRAGAGRKKSSPFVPHARREPIENRQSPLEIELVLRRGLPSFRSRALFQAFRRASLRARRFGLRIIEYRIEKKRIFMLVEFKTRKQLERSFKSLNTTLAIAIKARFKKLHGLSHTGAVFLDRYRMKRLSTPLALKLSLLNLFKPESQRTNSRSVIFSSWPLFQKGKKLFPRRILLSGPKAESKELRWIREVQASPQFWLTREGWLKV